MNLIISDGGRKGSSAYGSFKIFSESGDVLVHEQVVFGDYTSNQAEYLALIYALRKALLMNITDVEIFVDSLLVKNQITGDFDCRSGNMLPLLEFSRKLLLQFNSYTLKKVRRNLVVNHLGH